MIIMIEYNKEFIGFISSRECVKKVHKFRIWHFVKSPQLWSDQADILATKPTYHEIISFENQQI